MGCTRSAGHRRLLFRSGDGAATVCDWPPAARERRAGLGLARRGPGCRRLPCARSVGGDGIDSGLRGNDPSARPPHHDLRMLLDRFCRLPRDTLGRNHHYRRLLYDRRRSPLPLRAIAAVSTLAGVHVVTYAMADLISNLSLGFLVAVSLQNLFLCLLGVTVGTLVGVLPGVGSVATIAMLLPVTFGLPPVGALIMLAGIYYGAQYGGSTTSILVNIPGEATSVVTTLDGHQMAKQGRAGPALAIAAIGSFFAGCFATLLVAALGAPLTSVALMFGPAEYFSLMALGLIFAVVLAKGSLIKALAMILAGLLMSMVGSDLETGVGRMTFDIA